MQDELKAVFEEKDTQRVATALESYGDEDIKIAIGLSARSIERLRARCCEVGPLGALEGKPRKPSDPQIVTGEIEARITALNCS